MADPSPPAAARKRKRLRSPLVRREDGGRGYALDTQALRDAAWTVGPVLLAVVLAFWVAARYVKPAPPDRFVMSTGASGGAYHLHAQRYRDILARDGVAIELRPSAGSLDNLKRLSDANQSVDVAMAQAGVASADQHPDLVSLGALYYEPLWIFHRAGAGANQIRQLAGKVLAVGPEGSGTRALALQVLKAGGVEVSPDRLLDAGGDAAVEALLQGRADAAFLVAGPDAPSVQKLVRAKGVHLMSLAHADAYTRRLPFLSTITLPRGAIDIGADLPASDVTLVATTANLVARGDFHPALMTLLLQAASEVHTRAGMLQRSAEFPAPRESDFPLAEEATRFFKSGKPFLQRYLPFWLANLIERLIVLLVPLFAVLVPLMKLLPALIEMRVKSRVFRWYGELKFLEAEVADQPDPAKLEEYRDRLDDIERGVNATRVPQGFADYIYNTRAHIDLVRNRIDRIERELVP